MKCPECGVEINEQVSRCHSCGALVTKRKEKTPGRFQELGERTKRGMPFLFLFVYLLLVVIITLPLYSIFENRQKAERLHDRLGDILEKLEEFADANDQFPDDINQLVDEGLITAFPENPYHPRLMKPRPVGQPFSGDFTYIPVFDDRGRATGCVLVGYGPDLKKGQDIFTAGNDYSRLMQFAPEPDGVPDGVIVVLQAKRGEYRA